MLGIRTAAAIEPHWKRSPRIRSVGTPAESVRWLELEMNVVTYTNSLTQSENVKITTVRIPGSEIGKTMRRSAEKRERDQDDRDGDEGGGLEPARVVRGVKEVAEVRERRRRVEPERQVRRVEEIQRLLERRHRHPVEGEGEHDRERSDDEVRRGLLAQCEPHTTSALRAKKSITIATRASTGSRNSDTAAPAPSEPPWIPCWKAHVVTTCVELKGPPFVRM